MGGGERPRKTKTQNPLCGHCVCTGVLIQEDTPFRELTRWLASLMRHILKIKVYRVIHCCALGCLSLSPKSGLLRA